MKYGNKLKNIGMALLIAAGSVDCAALIPSLSRKIPVGEYVIVGEATKELLEETIDEPPVSGKKFTLLQACGMADNNPSNKVVIYLEAKKFAENYKENLKYAF